MDALTVATRAAYQAIASGKAQGLSGTTHVYQAIAQSGITVAEANAVSDDAVRMAFEVYAEQRAESQIQL